MKTAGQGPNALDFHIAFYLGRELAAAAPECVILSRDTGFDPLMRHLQELGHTCRRVISLGDAFPVGTRSDRDHFARLIALLAKEKSRPTKRKGLAGKVRSWFPQLAEDARRVLIQRLFDENRVRESEKMLAYDL